MLFKECAKIFNKLENISSRLEMTDILSEFFKKISKNETKDIQYLIYILQGIVAPPYESIDLGVGERFAIEAIAVSSGHDKKEVIKLFNKTGDLGLTAEKILSNKKQISLYTKQIRLKELYEYFLKIAKTSGKGSQELKIKYLIDILNSSSPLEAKYIIRFVLGELRLGVGEPTILDALSVFKMGDKSLRSELERAYNICSDLGVVAKTFLLNPKKFINNSVTN